MYSKFPKEIKEDISLDKMYEDEISEYADMRACLDALHVSDTSTTALKLIEYCKHIARDVQAKVSRLTEECERELENEVEQEEEMELQIPIQTPHDEVDWDFSQAFSDPDSLMTTLFDPLKKFVSQHFKDLSTIEWGDDLLCTPNFWSTIMCSTSCKDFRLYLRMVNYVLILPNSKVVLLSEYEADKLLPYWWKAIDPKATLQQLRLVISGTGFGGDDVQLSDKVRTAAKLFRGYVHFSVAEKDVLSQMFRGTQSPRKLIQELLSMRDRTRFLDRSELDYFSEKYVEAK